jgi:opacity protein-like surface antigen
MSRLGFAAAFMATLLAATDARAGKDFGPVSYFRMALGRELFVSPGGSPGLELQNPSGQPDVDLLFGVDLSKYWGLEFAVNYVKTDLRATGDGKLGDFSTISGILQARLRYPMHNDRFVPYALFGAGYGFGDFSGRTDPMTFPIGGRSWSSQGILGGGAEYFIYRNLAFGLELRDTFLFRPELTVNGQQQAINADSVALTAGLRVYFDSPRSGKPGVNAHLPPAVDTAKFRPYIMVRGGQALFTDTNALKSSNIVIDSTSGPLLSGGFGANFSRYWGAEFAFEYARAQIRNPTNNVKISGYPVWTMLGFARLRYPTEHDKVVPYLSLGAGLGWAEKGDPDIPETVSGFHSPQQTTFVGAAAVGVDYFVQDDVALTLEARDTFNFATDVSLNGVPLKLHPDFVSFSAGIRVFFQ